MRTSPLIALAIILITLAWIGSGALTAPDGKDPSESASASGPDGKDPSEAASASGQEPGEEDRLVEVRVQESEAQDRIRTLVVLGRTRANRTVDIRAETDGRVAALTAERGQPVKEGQALLHLDPADRQARLDEARALLEQRQLQYDASEKLQRRDFTSRVSLAEAKANLGAAKSQVAARALDLTRTRITAPFDGLLNDHAVEVGDYVQAGDKVATVVDLDPLLVRGHVTEQEVVGLEAGREGTAVLVDGRELKGRVRYVGAVAVPATRTFPVDLEIPNPGAQLPEGITGELRLPLASVRAHLVSPAVLALDDDGRVGVKYVDDDDRVAFTPVRIAGDGAEGFWVADLPDKLSIITIGQAFVSVGQKVKPVHATEISEVSRAQVEEAARTAGNAALDGATSQ
ncbi:MAG: efflux RND transporter periplasmic adaptor subunit [Rhodospirillum sp.]|nr:efflux RND transporter periplasmic adaptor subunit [Rhodospirillum sp.]MCF8491863.1 efflux RND transporter periplasmic adaptor subunit [Rhodospirillum sp.]